MPNPPNWREADLSAIDPRTIASLEWQAVKAEVNRRASVERKALLRRSVRRLWAWLRPIGRGRQERPVPRYGMCPTSAQSGTARSN